MQISFENQDCDAIYYKVLQNESISIWWKTQLAKFIFDEMSYVSSHLPEGDFILRFEDSGRITNFMLRCLTARLL